MTDTAEHVDDLERDDAETVALLAEQIERVPIDSITPTEGNPNEGDVGAIAESVDAVGGFYQVIFVQRSSGKIIAGEHRWRMLKAAGSTVAPVVFLDVDDEAAARILIGDNEIPRQRSRIIPDALAAVLEDLRHTPRGIAGTGHDDDSLNKLLMSLNEAPRHDGPAGTDTYEPVWAVMVECSTEDAQLGLLRRFEAEGLKCRALISG